LELLACMRIAASNGLIGLSKFGSKGNGTLTEVESPTTSMDEQPGF
jgi:hypothetical protein